MRRTRARKTKKLPLLTEPEIDITTRLEWERKEPWAEAEEGGWGMVVEEGGWEKVVGETEMGRRR